MLVDGRSGTGDHITSAIRSASRSTGAAFDYLLNTAMRESALDPSARARTSSARGLYQFIESTWLSMVKEEGPKFGLGGFARSIERLGDGSYAVRDPRARAQILKLREDPQISSVMAGALASRNAAELRGTLGRNPTSGELYVAHFLGSNGAKKLIQLQRSNPGAAAAASFPEAARANRAIFHRPDGRARSAGEVFAALTARHANAAVQHAQSVKPIGADFASLRPALGAEPATAAQRNGPAPRLAYAHPVVPSHTAFAAEEEKAFSSLFRDGTAGAGAVNPAVREIWGAFETDSNGLDGAKRGRAGAIGEPLDLLGHLKNGGRRTRLGS